MWGELYVHYVLMRDQRLALEKQAELSRRLREAEPRTASRWPGERVWRRLRRTGRPAPRLVPQMKTR